MLRASSKSNKFSRIALALAIGACASTSIQAQITLRPSENALRQSEQSAPYSSRRQEFPVSNETSPVIPSSPFTSSSNYTSPDRSAEFNLIQQEADALDRQLGLIRRIVNFASPSIVHIEATKKSEPGKGFASSRIEEAGAGVIVNIRNSLYVLTNRHVVHPAELNSIRLELNDGRVLRPTQVWADPSTDVAVLKIPNSDLIPARLGNSDVMAIGDFVLAVGSPFGLSHSVTYGIISAKGRRNLELGSKDIEIQDFFQTDAAINPGNSGGPLINLRGEIVGINTAIASNSGGNEGIGFSIPINMAVVVAEQLVDSGRLRRSYLGVQLENAFDVRTAAQLGLPAATGALVKSIIPGSPAELAGIQVGDVITEFNGRPVENDGHLVKSVGLTPVGSEATMTVYRNGTAYRVKARLKPSPEQAE